MSFLCNLFGHRASTTTLENQGFLFTRCTRCNHDMLRTAGTETKWRSVPAGFRVDWGKVDMRTFQDPSWIARTWRTTMAVFTTVDLVVSSVWWGMVDAINAMRCGGKDIFAATRRVIRVGAAPIKPRWNLSVNITVNRHQTMATAANDLGFVRGTRLVA